MGWMSVVGSIIFGLGFLCKAASGYFVFPELDQLGDLLISIGGSLGGIGIRRAIKNK